VSKTRGQLTNRADRGASQPSAEGFNFTQHIRAVCADMIARLPELAHIDLPRVAISFSQARKNVGHGLQATLTPMRFEEGRLWTLRRGQRYTAQRLFDDQGGEYLYILSFYLPRFLNHSLDEKLTTILHELWHIGPNFDGDLRRHEGRCYVHTSSEREYDAAMARLANKWLSFDPPAEVYGFLQLSFSELQRQFGKVYGTKIPNPRLIPYPAASGDREAG
jgi:hypothetical protein